MTTIRYRLHISTLIVAAVAYWLTIAFDAVPLWMDRVFYFFGLMGVLHATSLTITLRGPKAWRSIAAFVTLAAVVSAVTPFFVFLPMWLLSQIAALDDSAGFYAMFAFPSAIGAAGYWLCVRFFWLKSLGVGDLAITMILCAATTSLAHMVLSALAITYRADELQIVIPTAVWWATFSLALFLGETDDSGVRATTQVSHS